MKSGWTWGVTLVIVGMASAKGDSPETDIYAACDSLWATLSEISQQPVSDHGDVYECSLQEAFAGYDVRRDTISPDTVLYKVRLPGIEGLPPQILKIEMFHEGENDRRAIWMPCLVKKGDDWVLDDSLQFSLKLPGIDKNRIANIVDQRIKYYRRLAKPEPWDEGERIPWEQTTLRFHGPKLDALVSSSHYLSEELRYLTLGCLVYAGLISLKPNEDSFSVEYYIIVTIPERSFHHFMTVKERYSITQTAIKGSWITLDLFPFIRTDNLKSLYADTKTDDPNRPRIPIELNKP